MEPQINYRGCNVPNNRLQGIKSILIFISGSYIEKAGYEITKPGHGGGAVQFVAKQGSIVIGTNYLTSLSFLRYYVYYKSKLTTLANRSF